MSPQNNADSADANDATLPVLLSRLGEDVARLIDAKLNLLKIELQEDLWDYGRNLIFLIAAGIIAAVGFALVNVAIAFGLSELLASTGLSAATQHALGFALTGVIYLVAGAAVAIRSWLRLSRRQSLPGRALAALKSETERER
jgi:hypothetical protein